MPQTALITGASSGIGYELARLFARDGATLVLVARDPDKLAEAARTVQAEHSVSISVIPRDLSLAFAPDELWAELTHKGMTVDVLVNNAGFGTYGPFVEADLATELQMLHVNLVSLTHLTRLCLPGMIQRRRGRILNVASTAAFQPGPLMAVYYATKAYVLSFSEALADELRGSGVTVTALCPGPTQTEFQRRAGIQRTRLMRGRRMDAEAVARIGYRGLLRGQPVVIPGVNNRLIATLVRWLPRSLVVRTVRKVQENRR